MINEWKEKTALSECSMYALDIIGRLYNLIEWIEDAQMLLKHDEDLRARWWFGLLRKRQGMLLCATMLYMYIVRKETEK